MLKVATGDSFWISRGGPYERVEVPPAPSPFELQYADLSAAIRTDGETGCTPEYARVVVAVLEAFYRSAETSLAQCVCGGQTD